MFRLTAVLAALVLLAIALVLAACRDGAVPGPRSAPALPGDYPADLPRPDYPTAEIGFAGRRLTVEIADTPKRRAYGLMFVSALPEDRGMLFIYPTARRMSFWMRNTQIPLDIAFLADLDGVVRVVNFHAGMRPFQESPGYPSAGACRFALEVPAGWLARHDVRPGAVVDLPPELLARAAAPDRFMTNIPRRLGG